MSLPRSQISDVNVIPPDEVLLNNNIRNTFRFILFIQLQTRIIVILNISQKDPQDLMFHYYFYKRNTKTFIEGL